MSKVCAVFVFCILSLLGSLATAKELLVKNQQEYRQALKKFQPGDAIVLKNGEWKNFEILFVGQGTAEKPIRLSAETKGKVLLSGKSNLRIAGEYLVVSGLVFKNGYTPTGEVVAFKRNDKNLANNSRITEIVIDNYSNPDKDTSDYWVALYGKNNRFDHNYLAGKRNTGVTMAVRLDAVENQQNHHRIDHNYFGPRPELGSNGGETLRIGTSTYSLTDSFTLVEENYFDRCNGEVEIVSVKSGKNIIRNNVFFESRGTVTLRHGNGNLVEGNVFWGNGVDHTGGIRIINRDQVVRNNYLEGLTGTRFGSGFAIMNGALNPPINRYHQVVNAQVENNSFINVDNIQLAAGKDAERNAPPAKSYIKHNLIYNEAGENVFSVFDDLSGIEFSDNWLNNVKKPLITHGFNSAQIELKRNAYGLLIPVDKKLSKVGVVAALQPISKADVGPSWYPKLEPDVAFDSGKKLLVTPGEDALFNAIHMAVDGDILQLSPGIYSVNKLLLINKVITLVATQKDGVVIEGERSTLFELQNGGSLKLVGLHLSGRKSPDAAGNQLIRTLKSGMINSYRLVVENCFIENLNVNHSFHFFDAGSRSLASEINIKNSRFENITGDLLRLDKETDDLGIYNAEYVRLESNTFKNIEGAIVRLYRGGTDESTFGPHFLVNDNSFENVGKGSRNKHKSIFLLHGVQLTRIENNRFEDTAGIRIEHTVGEPDSLIAHNSFKDVPKVSVVELHTKGDSTLRYEANKEL